MSVVINFDDERRRRGILTPNSQTERHWLVTDFDVLECFACDDPVHPASVSKGPVVAYRCKSCGSSWRINSEGDMTHARNKTIG